ncbi:MAG: MFS transporter [Catenulispora sp. 13_1_20CM_3_70_7]|nr:MAG: MFS transporter [Catenulispora sp. 13_1_20CM_3_70_7]
MSTASISATPSTEKVVPQREPKPGLILATIATCQLMLVLDATIVNIALPKIRPALHFSEASQSWVLNAYTLAFGGLLLLGGRAGDILGRRRMFVTGVTLFTVASFIGGLAVDSGMLLASRALQGAGAAMAGPSMLALIITTFPEGAPRVKAMSLYAAVSSAGGSVGLLLGGMLTTWGSWRLVMYINVPIGAAAAIAAARLLNESPRQQGRFDIPGAICSVTGMSSLVYGFINASEHGWGTPVTIAAFVAAVVLLGAFVVTESKVEFPVFPLRLLKDSHRARAYGSYMLLVGAMFSMFYFMPQFMQRVLGYSPMRAGLAFLPLTVTLFAVSRFVPKLLPRFGPRPLIVLGTALISGALLWLAQIKADSGFTGSLLVPFFMFGLGGALAFSPIALNIMSGLAPRDSGAGSGLMQACQQIGAAVGIAVLVTISTSAAKGSHDPNPEVNFTHGLNTGLLVGSGIALTVCLISLTLKPKAPAAAVPAQAPAPVTE